MKNLFKKKFFINFLILCLTLSGLIYPCLLNIQNASFWVEGNENNLKKSSSSSPIDINNLAVNNWDFYNFTGTGTSNDPYIIEDKVINASGGSYCISIQNSQAYFIIRNCTLFGTGTGTVDVAIYLSNVSNGMIINNTCSENANGILIEESTYILMENNTIDYNSYMGVEIKSSCSYIKLNSNIISNNNYGIISNTPSSPSNFTLIEENKISDNTRSGIFISGFLHIAIEGNHIARNGLTKSGEAGIRLLNLYRSRVDINEIDNNRNGIYLETTVVNCSFHGNFIENSPIKQIWIKTGNTNNTFYGNYLLDCGSYNPQDDGSGNYWDNGSLGNYYSNYHGNDNNDDGIGDSSKSIYGTASSIDNYPIYNDGPEIKVSKPNNHDYFNTLPTFIFEAKDELLDTMWYIINDNFTHIFTSNDSLDATYWDSLSDGNLTLKFYANNTLRKQNFEIINIVKDTTAPIINLVNPVINQTFNQTLPTFNVEIEDVKIDRMWYSLNGGTNIFFTSNGTIDESAWNNLPNGTVTITFYANDTAGNIESESIEVLKNPPTEGGFTPTEPLGISFGFLYIPFILSVIGILIYINKKEFKNS